MGENNAKVSIVIPTYNYGRFIGELSDNLKGQAHQNWEAIIVDDGSDDDTPKLVKKIRSRDSRFIYLRTGRRGNAAARNLGIDQASGDFVQFLDADDFLSKHKLKDQLNVSDVRKPGLITYSKCKYFLDGKPDKLYPDFAMKGAEWMKKQSGRGYEMLGSLIKANFTVISSPLISRDFLKKNKLYFSEDLDSKVDWIFWMDCLLAGARFSYVDDDSVVTMIRRHPTSITMKKNVQLIGELIARERIDERIVTSELPSEKKEFLARENSYGKKLVLKDIMYHRNLNLEELKKVCRHSDTFTFFSYWLKGLNYKRKNLFK